MAATLPTLSSIPPKINAIVRPIANKPSTETLSAIDLMLFEFRNLG